MIIATKAAVATNPGLPYQWVMGQSNGGLYTSTSTTASSWTSRTSSFGTSDIFGICTNRVSQYVACGKDGKIATSPDGITWTQRTSSFGTTDIHGIAYGKDGYYVAVGVGGKIATSTDGITWTQRTSGTANALYATAFGNNLWVVAGGANMVTATDPTGTWTSRTSTLTGAQRNGVYYAPNQSIWVAGFDAAATANIASSTDGLTWTARNSTISQVAGGGGFASTASIIIIGCMITVGTDADVASSTDGITWTNRALAATGTINGACVDDAGFMIVIGSKVQSTTDGITYTDRGTVGTDTNWAICHSSGLPAQR